MYSLYFIIHFHTFFRITCAICSASLSWLSASKCIKSICFIFTNGPPSKKSHPYCLAQISYSAASSFDLSAQIPISPATWDCSHYFSIGAGATTNIFGVSLQASSVCFALITRRLIPSAIFFGVALNLSLQSFVPNIITR